MIRIQDAGEVIYGGGVTLAEWWDAKRIEDALTKPEGGLKKGEIFKRAGTYAYLVPGLVATVMSVFGVWRRYERWGEHISHGFFYDMPRFLLNLSRNMATTTSSGSDTAAVREARRIVNQTRALGAGSGRVVNRDYQPEFSRATSL